MRNSSTRLRAQTYKFGTLYSFKNNGLRPEDSICADHWWTELPVDKPEHLIQTVSRFDPHPRASSPFWLKQGPHTGLGRLRDASTRLHQSAGGKML